MRNYTTGKVWSVCGIRALLLVDMGLDIDQVICKARVRVSLPAPAVRRLIREQASLTQSDIAGPLGVDRASVSRWESGQQAPRGALREAYAQLLERLRRAVLG
jgi:DNA-binding XRE family transcriptional regulator